jgi:hypothetical protein
VWFLKDEGEEEEEMKKREEGYELLPRKNGSGCE